ncbi:MAG: hypothetical protein ACLQQ4_03760 [Bacteroidia bacterium]
MNYTVRTFLILLMVSTFGAADAQYYWGPPPPPPPPRHHQQQQEEKSDDNGVTQPSGYIGLSIGVAQPVGTFANANGTGYNGYALSGFNFNISLGLPIEHSNFGIAVQYSNCDNQFDINNYVNNVAIANQQYNFSGPIASEDYSTSFIMAGLFATLPVQRLSIDFKLMGGIALCYLPEITYNASAETYDPTLGGYDTYTWDVASSNSTSFAFGIGADLRYKFRRASLMLGVDYLMADPMISTQQTFTDNGYNSISATRIGGGDPISVVNAYIGIAYDIR